MTKTSDNLLTLAATELEATKQCVPFHHEFPSACRAMMYSLPGNLLCVDCGTPRPQWASVTYGVLLCVHCSGRHRSYGVGISKVRSVDMDAWTQHEILAMLEGGNDQLHGFFVRHEMGNNIGEGMARQRYRTKAALFYGTHLKRHVEDIASSGVAYQGRIRRNSQEREQPPPLTPTRTTTTKEPCAFHPPATPTMEAVRAKRTRKLPTATITRHMQ
ncbi:with coiled-coil, ANK repeat and PH domain-containing protein [Seminavis robusta]|uniref:With coiled-coil, ANK repeat and PH domain-containing protein n=1 Tax=Seminavis robusta TaxID=568900 RepID=A0A9N8H8I7_9STRA|nr:with coiled-coil, ANK repeat and PH domain-containing protein [Seminavis robusta]|eukprot:Sro93_g048310.1 with coiled-coil, ANK repeat and PH domain-containing protein (216) ;mRNA; f:15782-16429